MINEVIIEWTDEDIDHIRKHNIEPAEVESIFESRLFYKRREGFFDFLVKTRGGRVLFVVFERLWEKTYRVVMARDATPSVKNLYVRRAR